MSSTVTSWSPDTNTKASETTSTVLNNATLSGTLDVTGVISPSTHIDMPDSANIKLGTGDDLQLYHDGSHSYITNAVGTLKLATETSGIAVTIGHTTSEVTIGDNLTVTGTLTLGSGAELTEAELEMLDGITAGTVIASKAIVTDSNIDITGGRNITISGELDAATLDISGNVDIDGTTNLVSLDVVGDPGDNGTIVSFTNSHATVDDHDNILKLRFSGDADASEGNFILFGDGDTAEMGVIKANSATVVVDSYSDYRIKNTIATLSGGLAKVDALRPVTFKYNTDSRNATHEGFIAHEVQEQIPYAVRGAKDAVNDDGSIKKQSFCIYQLIPQMVSAIQELSAKVEALENA